MILNLQTRQVTKSASSAAADPSAMPAETYEIFIDDDRYAVPTLYLVTAADPDGAVALAERMVSESPHHRGAELCLDGRRITGIGSFALRQLPQDGPYREAAES